MSRSTRFRWLVSGVRSPFLRADITSPAAGSTMGCRLCHWHARPLCLRVAPRQRPRCRRDRGRCCASRAPRTRPSRRPAPRSAARFGRFDAFQPGDHPGRQVLRRQATACGRDVALGEEGPVSTSTPASLTQGFVVRSVQAGTPSSRPSLARTSVPEHCAASSCRAGSSRNAPSGLGSATTSRVCMPLPTMTASAAQASSRLASPRSRRRSSSGPWARDWRSTRASPAFLTRLRTPSAMRESSSLKPSKVRWRCAWGLVPCRYRS